MPWQFAEHDRLCGGICAGTIAAGQPMLVVSLVGVTRERIRCRRCAGRPVDWLEIVQHGLGAPRRHEPSAVPLGMSRIGELRPAFDAKMAAAGGRDDE